MLEPTVLAQPPRALVRSRAHAKSPVPLSPLQNVSSVVCISVSLHDTPHTPRRSIHRPRQNTPVTIQAATRTSTIKTSLRTVHSDPVEPSSSQSIPLDAMLIWWPKALDAPVSKIFKHFDKPLPRPPYYREMNSDEAILHDLVDRQRCLHYYDERGRLHRKQLTKRERIERQRSFYLQRVGHGIAGNDWMRMELPSRPQSC